MGSTTNTARLLALYRQMASPTRFLSGFFQSPKKNFHSSQEVQIDIIRTEEDVAIAIQSLAAGYRMNSTDLYTSKGFIPAIYKEAVPLNASDLLKRMPGRDPFKDPNFRGDIITLMFNAMTTVEAKIRRAVELQASQVLQTAKLVLTDENGNAVYSIDYKPKTTHFPTAGTSWASASGAQMLADINDLGAVVRADGLSRPDTLLMGITAYDKFFGNADVRARFDTRRIDQGTVSPMAVNGEGGEYRGIVEIGNYRYDVWTYDGRYTHPATGVSTQFLDDGNVVVLSSGARLDATFGSIPNIGRELGVTRNLIPELSSRLSNVGNGMDLFVNMWITNDGEQLFGGVGARPLMIPTAIDQYGCLITQL